MRIDIDRMFAVVFCLAVACISLGLAICTSKADTVTWVQIRHAGKTEDGKCVDYYTYPETVVCTTMTQTCTIYPELDEIHCEQK